MILLRMILLNKIQCSLDQLAVLESADWQMRIHSFIVLSELICGLTCIDASERLVDCPRPVAVPPHLFVLPRLHCLVGVTSCRMNEPRPLRLNLNGNAIYQNVLVTDCLRRSKPFSDIGGDLD